MDLLHAARAAYDEVDTFLNNLQQAEKRRDATIQSSFVGRPSAAPLKSSKALFSGQTWKDLVYACELERDDLKRFQGSAHDHERAAEVFNAACLQERQVVHDRRFAQALQEVDDDYWEKKGELIEDAFDPRTHLTHMEQPLITLIHAGFVRKRSENAGFAGCGAALVKDCGTVVWKGGESLGRKRGIEADYAAIVLGLKQACSLGLSRLKIYGLGKRDLKEENRNNLAALATEILDLSSELNECHFICDHGGPDNHLAVQLARMHAVQVKTQYMPQRVRFELQQQNHPTPKENRQKCAMKGNMQPAFSHSHSSTPDQPGPSAPSPADKVAGTKQQTAQQADTGGETCYICLETIAKSKMFRSKSCRHSFCKDCVKNFLTHEIKERHFPVLCPYPGCSTALSMNDCRIVLRSKTLIAKLSEIAAEGCIPEEQKFYCPNAHCSALLSQEDSYPDKPLQCPECNKFVCAVCEVLWHKDMTCEEFASLPGMSSESAESSFFNLARSKQWRQCLQCRRMIEKKDGCNHMRCICGAEFCYSCGCAWEPLHSSNGTLVGPACGCLLFDLPGEE